MNDSDLLPLHTPRLTLRRFTEVDVLPFLAYRNDPAVARYQSWESCDLVEATEFIRYHQSLEAGVPGQWLQIAIVLKGNVTTSTALRFHGKWRGEKAAAA